MARPPFNLAGGDVLDKKSSPSRRCWLGWRPWRINVLHLLLGRTVLMRARQMAPRAVIPQRQLHSSEFTSLLSRFIIDYVNAAAIKLASLWKKIPAVFQCKEYIKAVVKNPIF